MNKNKCIFKFHMMLSNNEITTTDYIWDYCIIFSSKKKRHDFINSCSAETRKFWDYDTCDI